MELVTAPVILMIVLGFVSALKAGLKKYQGFLNFIPLIAGVFGAVLGIIAFYVVPNIVPVDDVFNAILMGLFSGFSAIGSSEIVVNMKSFVESKKLEKEKKKEPQQGGKETLMEVKNGKKNNEVVVQDAQENQEEKIKFNPKKSYKIKSPVKDFYNIINLGY